MDNDRLTRYGRSVIRARGLLERGVATRWLGPWVALLLVLLIGLHPVSDEFVHEAAFICAAIALTGLVVLPLVGGRASAIRRNPERRRPAPCAVCPVAELSFVDGASSFPLRR